jgi:uncharacterized protein with PQ loop repeat
VETANIVKALGFAGALIGGYAYVPQILHLVKEKCSAGISRGAFMLWTFSSSLVLINAVYLGSPVFIFLCTMQLTASFTILLLSIRSNGHVCQSHIHVEKLLP